MQITGNEPTPRQQPKMDAYLERTYTAETLAGKSLAERTALYKRHMSDPQGQMVPWGGRLLGTRGGGERPPKTWRLPPHTPFLLVCDLHPHAQVQSDAGSTLTTPPTWTTHTRRCHASSQTPGLH